MTTVYSLSEIIANARGRSPFYRDLYASVPPGETRLERYPIIDQGAFWSANAFSDNRLLTEPLEGALIFKSGGTSGNPKFSAFSHDEWSTFTTIFGSGMNLAASVTGDRIANLFYAGELYASFLFIHDSIELSKSKAANFPISGSTSFESILKTCKDYRINTLAGVPTTLLGLVRYCENTNTRLPEIRKLIFGGESIYTDQRDYIRRVFPDVSIQSIGYASVDAGLLGYADPTCEPDEHRCFGAATIMEIVDEETGELIQDSRRPGRLLATNLTRKLMPIIRYPVGDRAEWVETSGVTDRKFRILGRSEEAARLGPVSLYVDDVARILSLSAAMHSVQGFQLVIRHTEQVDQCTVRLALATDQASPALEHEIVEALLSARPEMKNALDEDKIGMPRVEVVAFESLERNPRTGKLKRVIDLRKNS